ncbi:MAG: GNAT family N-acetyltransferase [Sandaracinaceae bacterium]|nr:GNAT family N-acetyltransferase [Sandaracinaceae bacterium]
MDEARAVLDFFSRNEAHLGRWEPARPDDFFTLDGWRKRLEGYRDQALAGASYRFHLFEKSAPHQVIGSIGLSNVIRGVFQCAHLGFGLDARAEGRGLMLEAVNATVEFAFETLELHRIEANHQPQNLRSAALLRRAGFEIQGYARDYLFIDGAWRDHVLTAKTRRT